MDHDLLVEEMKLTANMPVMERIFLAKRRRMRQLEQFTRWDQREAEMNECKKYIRKTKIDFTLEVRLFEAVTGGNLQELSSLLEEEVEPNIQNYEGLTPLHLCCIDGYYEMVYLLLQRGANVNATDMDGWTPLHAAATCGHKNIVKLLVQNGADLLASNSDEDMPFEITEDEAVLNFLRKEMIYQGITNQMVNEKRHAGHSELHKDIIKTLSVGGNLDDPITVEGATFLHVATGYFYNDLVEMLLQKGASSNTTDKEGWTPIHVAAYWGNEEAFKILVKGSEASINLQTETGDTPYDLCDNQDLKIYIQGLLTNKALQSSNLNINQLELDVLDIHHRAEKQVNIPLKDDLQKERSPKRRKSLEETLPIYPPLFNPKANELASDKRTSFREVKKLAPNIKTHASERLKEGLTDEFESREETKIKSLVNTTPNETSSNENTTPDETSSNENTTTDKIISNIYENTRNDSESIFKEPEYINEFIEPIHNNNNDNKNNKLIQAKLMDSVPNNNKTDIHNSSLQATTTPLSINTLSSLKKQRTEQRYLNVNTKSFSNINTKGHWRTTNETKVDSPDIMYIFKQPQNNYNYPSIVREKKCCCKLM